MNNDELYTRNWAFISSDLQIKLRDSTLLVTGCGLGSCIAHQAIRTGFGKLIACDGDVVELSNLNRQMFTQSDIGKNKAICLKERLLKINPKTEVNIVAQFLTKIELMELIPKADIVINTIDFDHSAFIDCITICREYKKPMLFPMNLGWGAAIYIFTPDSATLEETLQLEPGKSYSAAELKLKFISHAIMKKIPTYMIPTFALFKNQTKENWPCDPQLGVSAVLTSSFVITIATSLLAGEKVRVTPDVVYFDMHEFIAKE